MAIAIDDGAVYWLDVGDGTVMMASTSVAAPTPITLASGQAGPYGIAVGKDHVYWSNRLGGAVWSVAKAGGAPVLMSTATTPLDVAIDDAYLYWSDDGGVHRVLLAGGSATLIVPPTAGTSFRALGVNDARVYWATEPTFGVTFTLYAQNKDGSGARITGPSVFRYLGLLVSNDFIWGVSGDSRSSAPWQTTADFASLSSRMPLGAGLNQAYALDESYAYVFDSASLGKLHKCGGPLLPISSPGGSKYMAVDRSYVYWTEGNEVLRTPK
jgi:hypothetical protein